MNKRKTTEQFIIDATNVHGDRYDYSKVDYNISSKKVIIICKEHGDFLQRPNNHLNGSNCPKCTGSIKIDTDEFIKRAKLIHGDKYDYSKVYYKNCDTKVIIGCPKCGDYEQIPYNHLKGATCTKCRGHKKTTERFIKEATEIHGDKYDYSKVNYVNSKNKVIIICKIHGEIEQSPSSHLSGQGCYKCGNNTLKTIDEFILDAKKLHGDKYDYSKINYKGAHKKVIIGCSLHGDFEIKPNGHLLGHGCYKCGRQLMSVKLSSNREEFIQKSKELHGDTYDYSKVDYNGNKTKVIIICKTHGDFLQKPNGHLDGNGCPYCVNKTEGKLYDRISSVYPTLHSQFKQEWCKNIITNKLLPFDFCIPEHNIIIELDGPQHFRQISNWSTPEQQFKNDKYKEQCANDNGFSVIRLLQEDVFLDSYDWSKELCDSIEELKKGDEIANIYLYKKGEYDIYKKK